MTHYRAIPQNGGLFEIQYRKEKHWAYTIIGTAVRYDTGIISFNGKTYKSKAIMLRKLEQEKA